jgi:hypothetical protein
MFKLFATPVISWGVSGPEDQFYFHADDPDFVHKIQDEAEASVKDFLERVRGDVAKLPAVRKSAKDPNDQALFAVARAAVMELLRSRLLADLSAREAEQSKLFASIVSKIEPELRALSVLLMTSIKTGDIERSVEFFVGEVMQSAAPAVVQGMAGNR